MFKGSCCLRGPDEGGYGHMCAHWKAENENEQGAKQQSNSQRWQRRLGRTKVPRGSRERISGL